jgi:hypothetical protein
LTVLTNVLLSCEAAEAFKARRQVPRDKDSFLSDSPAFKATLELEALDHLQLEEQIFFCLAIVIEAGWFTDTLINALRPENFKEIKLNFKGNESQASPKPSESESFWSLLATAGQLSVESETPSWSASEAGESFKAA